VHEALDLPVRYVILFPVLLAVLIALFLSPGLLASTWLVRNRGMRILYTVPLAALTGGLVGYATFWVWLASPAVGRWFSVAILLLEILAAVALLATKPGRFLLRHVDVAFPLALLLLVALLYNGAATSCLDGSHIPCVFGGPSWDNALPKFFADHVAAGQPRLMVGDWLGSDRPPLQSGIVLAQNLLTGAAPFANVSYQLLSSALQCLWIVALWVVARRMRVPTSGIAVMIAMCVCSGFFFYNSVYVWPKLLAAAFGLIGFCLLVAEPRRRLYWGMAAACFASGMLSHSGIVFTLVPIGALLVVHRRYRPSLKMAAVGVGVAAALMGPWLAYQHYYDPPGNRLMKWHLAGVIGVDDRGVGQALIDSYSTTPMSALVDARVRNARMVLGAIDDDLRIGGTGVFAGLRGYEWSVTLLGIGLLNLGWLGLAFPAVRRRWLGSGIDRRLVRLAVVVGLTALALWILAMFLPYAAMILQGSYLTMMLLMIGFAAMLSVWPWRALVPVIAVQFGYFGLVWVASFYLDGGHLVSREAIAGILLGLAGLGLCLWRLGRRPDQAPHDVRSFEREHPVAVRTDAEPGDRAPDRLEANRP
jgi:hypothetical protein